MACVSKRLPDRVVGGRGTGTQYPDSGGVVESDLASPVLDESSMGGRLPVMSTATVSAATVATWSSSLRS